MYGLGDCRGVVVPAAERGRDVVVLAVPGSQAFVRGGASVARLIRLAWAAGLAVTVSAPQRCGRRRCTPKRADWDSILFTAAKRRPDVRDGRAWPCA